MRGRKLRSSVNWQQALNQKGVRHRDVKKTFVYISKPWNLSQREHARKEKQVVSCRIRKSTSLIWKLSPRIANNVKRVIQLVSICVACFHYNTKSTRQRKVKIHSVPSVVCYRIPATMTEGSAGFSPNREIIIFTGFPIS
jgi:hypothetical protein